MLDGVGSVATSAMVPSSVPEVQGAASQEEVTQQEPRQTISSLSMAQKSPRALAKGAFQAMGRARNKNNRASLSFYKASTRQLSVEEFAEKHSPCPMVHRLVSHKLFDTFFALLILANAFVIAAESQYKGWGVGFDLGYPNTFRPEDFSTDIFGVAGFAFGCMFLFEITLKVIGLGALFFTDYWNIFDMMIVVFWLLEESLASVKGMPDASLLRILRLVKLFRIVRVVRTIQGFDALYLMTTALWGSATILAWSSALIFLVLMMLALICNQILLETYISSDANPLEHRLEVYEYFGTFSRSLLSLFEMTLANWPPVCRLLVENVSEAYLIPALIHKLTIGFAVVGVINGVFMQETFKVASTDDRIMVRQKTMSLKTHEKKMRALFDRADHSGDGYLDQEEFRAIVSDDSISTWLASMDLVASDVDLLFDLIDNGDGLITVEELIEGVSKLKGNARSIDLQLLMRELSRVQDNMTELSTSIQSLQSQRLGGTHFQRTTAFSPRQQSTVSFNTSTTCPSSTQVSLSNQAQEALRQASPRHHRPRPARLSATDATAVEPKLVDPSEAVRSPGLPPTLDPLLIDGATLLNI